LDENYTFAYHLQHLYDLCLAKEGLKWNYIAGFLMIIGAVFFVFKKW